MSAYLQTGNFAPEFTTFSVGLMLEFENLMLDFTMAKMMKPSKLENLLL